MEARELKVFLSWSGQVSRSVASVLNEWLGLVAQHVQPWMSDAEIKSGDRWNDALAVALDETDFGIVCVTRENQNSPWLMFESGALAKRLGVARLIPLCINLAPAEITSPLQAFQGRALDKEGMRKLVLDLSDLAPNPRRREDINKLFEAMWPGLYESVEYAKEQSTSLPEQSPRTQEDMLSELVTRIRSLEHGISGMGGNALDYHDISSLSNAADQLILGMRRVPELLSAVDLLASTANRIEGMQPLLVSIQQDIVNREIPVLEPGDRVIHLEHGAGSVREIDGAGPGRRAKVAFDSSKEMWLVLRKSPVQKV